MSSEQWKKDNADKMREYRRKHYHNNKEPYLQRAKNNNRLMKEWYHELKSTFACPCGENHPACLQFHHRDPKEKDFDLSVGAAKGYNKQRIRDEISKCDVLCANCHFKLHYEMRQDKLD